MKITKVQSKKEEYNVYKVTLTPNWLEKILGLKEAIGEFKDTGDNYMCGGGSVYINKNGDTLSNHSDIDDAIDRWRRKF